MAERPRARTNIVAEMEPNRLWTSEPRKLIPMHARQGTVRTERSTSSARTWTYSWIETATELHAKALLRSSNQSHDAHARDHKFIQSLFATCIRVQSSSQSVPPNGRYRPSRWFWIHPLNRSTLPSHILQLICGKILPAFDASTSHA